MVVLKKNCLKEQERKNYPIESQQTAAWANIEEIKPFSNLGIPNSNEVRNAKDWVDANQK